MDGLPRVFENGRSGLERLGDCHLDLIVLDLMVPEMDGFAFDQIRGQEAADLRADRSRRRGRGRAHPRVRVSDLITKPVDEGLLLAKIHEAR